MSSPTTEAPKPETRPKLPEGWRWVRLGEISEVIAGQSPPSATYRKAPEGLPFFQGKADFGERHPVATVWCTSPKKTAEAGDILISVRAPVGPTNIADQRCCIGRGLAAIRVGGLADRDFILWAIRRFEAEIAKRGSGSTFDSLPVDELRNFPIPLPPLETQRRIATILTEQMGAVEKARKAAEEGLEAARKLAGAYTVASFRGPKVADWDRVPLADISTFLPAKSIASDGDTEVLAITTACLSESGFRPKGIKTARMWANDAREATVSPGEILIARSNTPELVGRVAVYPGGYPNLVASDLTIRIKATGADPAYLGAYLSSLYLSGYWKERAGGASGSMKKITRGQLQAEHIPLPDLETQRRTVAELNSKTEATKQLVRHLEAQLEAIRALPAAILRRAFSGEL